jgi:hypothetical protein
MINDEEVNNMPRGNEFSISDAKNEDGEWIMSPEQIRAEMAYDPSDSDYYGDDAFFDHDQD